MDTQNFKTKITEHAYVRISERLEKMTKNNDITVKEEEIIKANLNATLNYDFKPNKSYGVMLGRFNINPNSKLVTYFHKPRIYYEIYSADKNDIMLDSTGNEIWGVVRNNGLVTAFLRKTIQRQTAHEPRNMGGLGVDIVIDNINTWKPKY